MTFEWTPLGEILEFSRSPIEVVPEETYRRIGIYSWAKGFLHRDPASGNEIGSLRYFTFPSRSLILSNIQAWEGAIAVAGPPEHGFVASNRFLPYVPKGGVDIRYVFYYLSSDLGMRILQSSSPGTTARNRTLRRSLFESAEIPLPDIAAQKAIADRLDRISLVDRPSNIVSSTSPIRDRLLEAQSDTAHRVELSKVLQRSTSTVPVDAEAEYSMLGLHNRWRGPFYSGTIRGSDTKYKYLRQVSSGDLVYIKLSAWDGAFGFIPSDFDGYFVSPEFILYSVDETVDRHYLRAALRSPDFVSAVQGESRGTNVNRRRLQPEIFESIRIPLPSPNLQRELGVQLSRIDLLASLDTRRANLLKSLLPAARNEEFRNLLNS